MVEEKVETMAGWFNEMRMNGGIPSIGIERFILENHPQLGEMQTQPISYADPCEQEMHRYPMGATGVMFSKHEVGTTSGHTNSLDNMASDKQACTSTPKSPSSF